MRQQQLLLKLTHLSATALLSLSCMSAWAVTTPSTCHVDLLPLEERLEIARLEKELGALIATLRSNIAQITKPAERARLEAELRKILLRVEAPLDLPACQVESEEGRAYVREVVLRIENCGAVNFPKSDGQSLYGAVTIAFITDTNGQLVSSSITQRDDDARINLHALRIIRASTPFGKVPMEMRHGGYERFHYFTEFNFAHADGAGTGSSEPKVRCSLGDPNSLVNKAMRVSPPSAPSTPTSP